MTLQEKVLIRAFNQVAFSKGAELDKNMKIFFGLKRLEGESDEKFLIRADEIIFKELDKKLDKESHNGNL